MVSIEDFDVGVVEAMLHFMYNFDYINVNGTSSMVFEAQVYQIADKYDISSLKEHAKKKFGAAIDIGWSMDDFPLAITVAYTTSPLEDRGLRDLIIETCNDNINGLLEKSYFCEVLRSTNDFAADLVPSLCTPGIKYYKCPSCGGIFPGDMPSGYRYCPLCNSKRDDWHKQQQ